MKKNIVHIIILLLISCVLFVTLLILPYKYEWDPNLKQINDSAVDVLKMFYIILLFPNIIGLSISKYRKQKILYLYIGITLFVFYKLIKTFF